MLHVPGEVSCKLKQVFFNEQNPRELQKILLIAFLGLAYNIFCGKNNVRDNNINSM